MSRARKLAGFGSAIGQEQNPVNIQVGVMTAIKLFGDGSELTGTPGGLGTALSEDLSSPLNKIYYTDQNLSIGSTITVNPPASAKVAYTQYSNIVMEGEADLIISDDDDLIVDILGISTLSDQPGILQNGSGRIRVDNITDKQGLSSPAFPYGLTVNAGAAATLSGNASVGGVLSVTGDLSGSSATFAYGTNAAPTISGTDVDTGINFPRDGRVDLVVGGAQRLMINNTTGVSSISGIHVTGNNTPTSGAGLEIFKAASTYSQLQSFDRDNGNLQGILYKGSYHEFRGGTNVKALEISNGGGVNVATGSTLMLGDDSITSNTVYNYENIAGGMIKKYYVRDTLNAGQLTRFTFSGTNRTCSMITINATGSWTASNTGNNHVAAQFMCRVFTNSSGTSSDNSTVTTPFASTYSTSNYAFNNSGGFGYSIDITNPTGDDGVQFFYEVIVQSAITSSRHKLVSSTTA
jgi:hypothetical protein